MLLQRRERASERERKRDREREKEQGRHRRKENRLSGTAGTKNSSSHILERRGMSVSLLFAPFKALMFLAEAQIAFRYVYGNITFCYFIP